MIGYRPGIEMKMIKTSVCAVALVAASIPPAIARDGKRMKLACDQPPPLG
jgi:hypothetical protein